jgi:hypothetical protein
VPLQSKLKYTKGNYNDSCRYYTISRREPGRETFLNCRAISLDSGAVSVASEIGSRFRCVVHFIFFLVVKVPLLMEVLLIITGNIGTNGGAIRI